VMYVEQYLIFSNLWSYCSWQRNHEQSEGGAFYLVQVMDGNKYSSTVMPSKNNFIHLLKWIGEIWQIHLFKSTPHTFGGENLNVCFSCDVPPFRQIILIYIYIYIYIHTHYMLHFTPLCVYSYQEIVEKTLVNNIILSANNQNFH
jgi:hypothetical protein